MGILFQAADLHYRKVGMISFLKAYLSRLGEQKSVQDGVTLRLLPVLSSHLSNPMDQFTVNLMEVAEWNLSSSSMARPNGEVYRVRR